MQTTSSFKLTFPLHANTSVLLCVYPHIPTVSVGELLSSRDEAEREAVRRHASWAVKQARGCVEWLPCQKICK